MEGGQPAACALRLYAHTVTYRGVKVVHCDVALGTDRMRGGSCNKQTTHLVSIIMSGADAGEITTTLLCNLEAQVAVKSGCVAASDRVNGEQSGFGESRIAGGKSKDG
jgi:hypothetical protein